MSITSPTPEGTATAEVERRTPNDAVSMDIAAPPERVWALVSDITNMPRWSPETYKTRWIHGAKGPLPGARFKGTNRWGWIRWSSICEVEVAEPGREFTFVTYITWRQRTRWSYVFEPVGGGARVTESRYSISKAFFHTQVENALMHGHQESFEKGMRATLQRIKAAAEQS